MTASSARDDRSQPDAVAASLPFDLDAVALPLSLSQRPCKRCDGSYGICFHPDDCDKKETP